MSQNESNAGWKIKLYRAYCSNKGYQVQESEEEHCHRLDISNLSEPTIVKIYYKTGKILNQGKQNKLREEMEKLKQQIETNPQSFSGYKASEMKACATRYNIMLPELRTKIKESLSTLDGVLEITESPKTDIEFRAKITKNSSSLTITQYKSGTLLLQGKTDKLFDENCDLIESVANPSDQEIIARFISSDDENLRLFAAKYTPELIDIAEGNVRQKIGDVYDYLEPHDQRWLIASECLCLTRIPLPEYSPYVMPASKAFEGFAKKLLVDIGLFAADYFKKKNANFSDLYNKQNPKRTSICGTDRYASTFLDKLGVCLDMYRNFMMHSDESKVTKVDSQDEAEGKVNSIFRDTKEIFEYFNTVYKFVR